MRVAATSDLHYGVTKSDQIAALAFRIRAAQPNVLLVLGDIGEGPKAFFKCLDILVKNVACPVAVVAGNHDLWTRTETTSRILWDATIPKMCRDVGVTYLEQLNLYLEDVAFVGSYLHYDYSVKHKTGPAAVQNDDWYEYNKGSCNNDAYFMKGLPPDKVFAKEIGDAFQERLRLAQDSSGVQHIVVGTHVPCMDAIVTYREEYAWSVPYFGNVTHEPFIKTCDKVRWVVGAHSHAREEAVIDRGNMLPIHAQTVKSDYRDPAFILFDPTGDLLP